MKKLNYEGYLEQDEMNSSCQKCGSEQNEIFVDPNELPEEVMMFTFGWCEYRVLQCPSCKAKAIQFTEEEAW